MCSGCHGDVFVVLVMCVMYSHLLCRVVDTTLAHSTAVLAVDAATSISCVVCSYKYLYRILFCSVELLLCYKRDTTPAGLLNV